MSAPNHETLHPEAAVRSLLQAGDGTGGDAELMDALLYGASLDSDESDDILEAAVLATTRSDPLETSQRPQWLNRMRRVINSRYTDCRRAIDLYCLILLGLARNAAPEKDAFVFYLEHLGRMTPVDGYSDQAELRTLAVIAAAVQGLPAGPARVRRGSDWGELIECLVELIPWPRLRKAAWKEIVRLLPGDRSIWQHHRSARTAIMSALHENPPTAVEVLEQIWNHTERNLSYPEDRIVLRLGVMIEMKRSGGNAGLAAAWFEALLRDLQAIERIESKDTELMEDLIRRIAHQNPIQAERLLDVLPPGLHKPHRILADAYLRKGQHERYRSVVRERKIVLELSQILEQDPAFIADFARPYIEAVLAESVNSLESRGLGIADELLESPQAILPFLEVALEICETWPDEIAAMILASHLVYSAVLRGHEEFLARLAEFYAAKRFVFLSAAAQRRKDWRQEGRLAAEREAQEAEAKATQAEGESEYDGEDAGPDFDSVADAMLLDGLITDLAHAPTRSAEFEFLAAGLESIIWLVEARFVFAGFDSPEIDRETVVAESISRTGGPNDKEQQAQIARLYLHTGGRVPEQAELQSATSPDPSGLRLTPAKTQSSSDLHYVQISSKTDGDGHDDEEEETTENPVHVAAVQQLLHTGRFDDAIHSMATMEHGWDLFVCMRSMLRLRKTPDVATQLLEFESHPLFGDLLQLYMTFTFTFPNGFDTLVLPQDARLLPIFRRELFAVRASRSIQGPFWSYGSQAPLRYFDIIQNHAPEAERSQHYDAFFTIEALLNPNMDYFALFQKLFAVEATQHALRALEISRLVPGLRKIYKDESFAQKILKGRSEIETQRLQNIWKIFQSDASDEY